MSKDNIQEIVDRINAAIQYYPFADNLEEMEIFTKDNNGKKSLFMYWNNFVTMNMINAINEELGTGMNYIFHDGKRLNTIVHLEEVITK